ncbi:hypothetical protein GCM10009864_82770 [Streptomyces lunalinharesii]|uniref:Uncharacterized protein n=1 Tax=Streptomyces lunalinharesii TaxID=333384 RepID=A0ABN3T824_9ACTN
MTATPSHATVLHASDLTTADIDAAEKFLKARIHKAMSNHATNSDEFRMAQAMDRSVFNLVNTVRTAFDLDDGSRSMLRAKQRHWNELCNALAPWENSEEYDTARWQPVDYLDPQHAVETAEYLRSRL